MIDRWKVSLRDLGSARVYWETSKSSGGVEGASYYANRWWKFVYSVEDFRGSAAWLGLSACPIISSLRAAEKEVVLPWLPSPW